LDIYVDTELYKMWDGLRGSVVMGDRDYWQNYRDRLNSRISLMRAGLEIKFNGVDNPPSSSSRLTHGNIRDIQKVREYEDHLAAVERLLARNGHLE
jgi:hypothetical protein